RQKNHGQARTRAKEIREAERRRTADPCRADRPRVGLVAPRLAQRARGDHRFERRDEGFAGDDGLACPTLASSFGACSSSCRARSTSFGAGPDYATTSDDSGATRATPSNRGACCQAAITDPDAASQLCRWQLRAQILSLHVVAVPQLQRRACEEHRVIRRSSSEGVAQKDKRAHVAKR